jgi:hypothetical protein
MKIKALREFNSTSGNAKVDDIMDVDLKTAEFWVEQGFAEIIDPEYAGNDESDDTDDDDQTDA